MDINNQNLNNNNLNPLNAQAYLQNVQSQNTGVNNSSFSQSNYNQSEIKQNVSNDTEPLDNTAPYLEIQNNNQSISESNAQILSSLEQAFGYPDHFNDLNNLEKKGPPNLNIYSPTNNQNNLQYSQVNNIQAEMPTTSNQISFNNQSLKKDNINQNLEQLEQNILNNFVSNTENIEHQEIDIISGTETNTFQKFNQNQDSRDKSEDLGNSYEGTFIPEKKSNNSKTKYEKIDDLLDLVIEKNASDLHLTAGYPAFIRIDDNLAPVGEILTPEDTKRLILQSLTNNQIELLDVNREVDLSYQHKSGNRFRVNAYYQKGSIAAAYRLIPSKIRSVAELGLPQILIEITKLSQGLFLVTGPTGSGKSTTLAAMIQHINENYSKHIITIEDPIEYVYTAARSLVDQRELGSDTHDWNIAMKSALRQDPDVILIGELRDFETIQLAITLAETGHLVFATLHTNSASQSVDRIIDVFPPHQQQQIRIQLASTLKGVLSQRLVPLIGGGRTATIELLLVTNAVQNLIREGKTYQIDNVIATSIDLGMISLEKSLVKLVRENKITLDTAFDYSIRPEELQRLLKGSSF